MSALRRFALLGGCALAAAAAIETQRWLRPVALAVARAGQPYAALARNGTGVLAQWEDRKLPDGRTVSEWHVYDKEGRSAGVVKPHVENPLQELGQIVRDAGDVDSNPWVRMTRLDRRIDADSGAAGLARPLRTAQGWYAFAGADGAMAIKDSWVRGAAPGDAVCWWTFEDGRFVCRNLRDDSVLAGFGPDGFVAGAAGARGEKFAADAEYPGPPWFNSSPGASWTGTLLDSSARRVHFVTVPPGRAVNGLRAAPTKTPIRVEVATVHVEGMHGEAPVFAMDARNAWRWQSNVTDPAAYEVPLLAGRELIFVRRDGIERRVALADDEMQVVPTNGANFVATVLPPVGGPVERLRLRTLVPPHTDDVETIPLSTGGRVATATVGLVCCLRPPLLQAASWALPAPKDYEDYFERRLTDGVVAGGAATGWLVASLALGAACAWFVGREARRRDPRRAALWTALGGAFGLLALIWMRIAMPKSHVAACACGRPRAAHVDRCPSCAADWPAPKATGVEVFA
jgi:hypothetical protein